MVPWAEAKAKLINKEKPKARKALFIPIPSLGSGASPEIRAK
jgi:hypothetical protein